MAQRAGARSGHTISRLADPGEDGMRHRVALPLRLLAGAFGICEALLRTAADAVADVDPIDERVVELQRRLDSLEEQTTGDGESSATTSASRKRAPTGAGAAPGAAGPE